ncbi:amidohydrolase family protein [Clostridium tetani]|uniref:amidohydrolase n=1 Tax=Clostridium tetani TaxID=1513 RepID=UPI0038B415A8
MLLIKNCNLIDMVGIHKEKYDILINKKKIFKIEKEIDEKQLENVQVVDAKGRIVTPGLIDPHCHMGVYGTATLEGMDGNETSNPSTPELRAIDAIDPMDVAYDVAIKHGVTTVVTGPGSANVIGGTFTAMKTYGNDIKDCVIKEEVCMKMALGENPKVFYGKQGKAPKTRMMNAAIMRENLFKAKEYHSKWKEYKNNTESDKNISEFKYDLGMHSLMRVFDGLRVKVHAHQSDDILTAIRICEEFGLRYTIDHCTAGYLIVDELKSKGVQCIIGPTAGGKSKLELQYKNLECARIFEESGIDFAIMTDNPVIPIEGQLMQLALFVKNGLSKETALKGITINAARLTDIDDRVGSIEIGKDADIVIWNVDPLDTMSEAGIVIIDGQVIYERKAGEIDVDYKKL